MKLHFSKEDAIEILYTGKRRVFSLRCYVDQVKEDKWGTTGDTCDVEVYIKC